MRGKEEKEEGRERKKENKKKTEVMEKEGERKEERKGVEGEEKKESGRAAIHPGSAGSLVRSRGWSNLVLSPGLCFLTSKLNRGMDSNFSANFDTVPLKYARAQRGRGSIVAYPRPAQPISSSVAIVISSQKLLTVERRTDSCPVN